MRFFFIKTAKITIVITSIIAITSKRSAKLTVPPEAWLLEDVGVDVDVEFDCVEGLGENPGGG